MLTFLGAVIIWHAVKKIMQLQLLSNSRVFTSRLLSFSDSNLQKAAAAAAALISSQQQQQARPAALFTQVVAVMTDWLIRGGSVVRHCHTIS